MTKATANLNTWIAQNATKLKNALSSPSFDEDAFQDAYLTLATECREQETSNALERAFMAAYRKHTGRHLSETYSISHPDEMFFTFLTDTTDEDDQQDTDIPGTLVNNIRRYIRNTFPEREASAFEMRMNGYTYRDITDVTGLGATAFNNSSGRIIAATRIAFAGIIL